MIFIMFLSIAGTNHQANAQVNSNQKQLTQYVLKSWNTEDGLTSESASTMIQSDDGYIWVGTYTGLHQFDGKEFTVFSSKNSNIPSSNVLKLDKDKDGNLWIGTMHGIARYQDGEFTIPKGLEAVSNYSIEEMLVTEDGSIWFSTKSNQLFFYQQDSLIDFTNSFNVSSSTILAIAEDSEGTMYFGTDDSQLIIYKKDEDLKQFDLGLEVNGVNNILSSHRHVYLGTGRGLYIWDGSNLVKSTLLKNIPINTILLGENQSLWLGTMQGLFRYTASRAVLDSLTEKNGIPNNIVQDLVLDSEGNLWVATYRSGIFLLTEGSISSYSQNDGLATNIISSVVEMENGTFLLGNENGELNLIENGRITEYKPPIPIPTARLKNLFYDSKKRIWVCTYGGLVVLDGTKGYLYSVTDGFPDNFTRVAFEDREGTIWLGTKNAGLILFNSLNEWTRLSIDDGLSSNYILSIEQLGNGDIVVATINGLNIIRDREVIKNVTVDDGLPSNFMFATHATDNYIWIASNDGLSGYNEERVINFNTENGMPTNIIYDILEDEQGNLWMPSENSILSISLAELEAAALDSSKTYNVKQFDQSDGMKNSHCIGAVLSFIDSEKRFWVPTIGGVAVIDPDQIRQPDISPKLIVESIYADNQKIPIREEVVVPAKTNRLLIDFTGISYGHTEKLQFRYKLEPFDEDWVEASTERDGLYTNLSPGRYEFQLQTGIDNVFFEYTLKQPIFIRAAWWQTAGAKIVLVFTIICLALFVYWVRLRALTRSNTKLEETVQNRTQELEDQKQELKTAINKLRSAQEQMVQSDKMASLGILAAGVAHEINNPLNFIQGGVDGLEQTLKRKKGIKKEDYEVLIAAVKEGIDRASTIVSSLNEFSHSSENKQEPCNIHHLIENCLTMIQYQLKHGIELVKDFTTEEVKVMGNNGKLHQAFLNIITNSIQAIETSGTITVSTQIKGKNVIITFTDTGHGVKPEHLKKITEPFFSTKDPGKGTGLGLSITYSIIHEHKGKLKYESEWGAGTTARITLPLYSK